MRIGSFDDCGSALDFTKAPFSWYTARLDDDYLLLLRCKKESMISESCYKQLETSTILSRCKFLVEGESDNTSVTARNRCSKVCTR